MTKKVKYFSLIGGILLLTLFFLFFFKNKKVESKTNYLSLVDKTKIVSKTSIENIKSILLFDNNRYVSFLYDETKEKEINIQDLIKENSKTDFYSKITELLYLKYPKFVADILNSDEVTKVYYLLGNKLMIYYYDYNLTLSDLNLSVYYKEIYKYLNIDVYIDDEVVNESGYDYSKDKKTVAITFDDGPSKETTLNLLNVLQENKAHASFFVLGSKLLKQEEIIKEITLKGNEIGYHSYDHKNMKRQTIEEITTEYNETNELYKTITGKDFNYIRPPYGNINNEIKSIFNKPIILWSLDTNDWKHRDSNYLYNYVISNVKDGDIILFHDIYKTSVEAIKKILPELYLEGFQVVSVGELAYIKGATLIKNEEYHKFII